MKKIVLLSFMFFAFILSSNINASTPSISRCANFSKGKIIRKIHRLFYVRTDLKLSVKWNHNRGNNNTLAFSTGREPDKINSIPDRSSRETELNIQPVIQKQTENPGRKIPVSNIDKNLNPEIMQYQQIRN